jgi:hypothetical protein
MSSVHGAVVDCAAGGRAACDFAAGAGAAGDFTAGEFTGDCGAAGGVCAKPPEASKKIIAVVATHLTK